MKFAKKVFVLSVILSGFLAIAVPFTAASFSDVPSTSSFADGIGYVQQQNIVQGYTDGTFKPEQSVNRAEFTKIIISTQFPAEKIDQCLSQNVPDAAPTIFFRDVSRSAWFAKYICMAKVNKIIQGYTDGTFAPEKSITFTEAAKIIVQSFGFATVETPSIWYQSYVEKLADLKAIPVSIFVFEQILKRGEMAEMIFRLKTNLTSKSSKTYEDLSEAYQKQQLCGTVSFRSLGEIAFGEYLLTEENGVVWTLKPEDGASSNILEGRLQKKTCISYVPADFPDDFSNHIVHVISGAAISEDVASKPSCELIPDAGLCKAFIPKFFFDKSTQKCTQFIWGGCAGTVPFDSLEACQSTCEKNGASTPVNVKEFNLTAKPSGFEPAEIKVKNGDLVRLNITSADVTIGFSLPNFNVNSELTPGKTVQVEFVANQVGTFSFFCVLCGPGYSNMKGSLIVEP